MSVPTHLREEIQRLDPDSLDELLRLVQVRIETQQAPRPRGFLARLREIRIDAPPDLSSRLDRNDVDQPCG